MPHVDSNWFWESVRTKGCLSSGSVSLNSFFSSASLLFLPSFFFSVFFFTLVKMPGGLCLVHVVEPELNLRFWVFILSRTRGVVCICMYVFSGWRSSWHACLAILLFCMYMERVFVYSCRRLRWVLPQRKLLSCSLVLLIVRVFVCVRLHLCAQPCGCLCSVTCADENRVTMLHLKGAVINEMNKRPWQQLDNTEEIKKYTHTHHVGAGRLSLAKKKKQKNQSAKQP